MAEKLPRPEADIHLPSHSASHHHRERVHPWMAALPPPAPEQSQHSKAFSDRFPLGIRSAPLRHTYAGGAPPAASSSSSTSSSSPSVDRQTVISRLLEGANPTQQQNTRSDLGNRARPASYGSTSTAPVPVKKLGRRHSILRMSSSAPIGSTRLIKKSASVEFALNMENTATQENRPRRLSGSCSGGREMPRRLTFEEREELYRVRPDLEIGPYPFYQEQMEELNRRNQRRILFSIFGGVLTLLMLMVFYYLLSQAGREDDAP